MELMLKTVHFETDLGVAWIKLAAPQKGNVLNPNVMEQLSHSLQEVIGDESCRVITISAEGSDFCKGIDIEWLSTFSESKADPEFFRMFVDCLTLIRSTDRPVIACVEGNVTGGGVGLVAACDLVLATENVVFMLPEVILGMIPALIAPFLLRRLTSAQVNYMALSTRGINTVEAKELGLVDEVATDGMTHTLNRQLQRLFHSYLPAIIQSKKYFVQLDAQVLQQQTEIALNKLTSWLEQPDVLASIKAFNKGFTPFWFQKYKGRSHA